MEKLNEAKEKKPFHESIVTAIQLSYREDIGIIANLIMNTKIPENHDNIVKAWKSRLKFLDSRHNGEMRAVYSDVTKSILLQKQEFKKVDKTFLSDNLEITHKLSKLGHAFSQAVAENNEILARSIHQKALELKMET